MTYWLREIETGLNIQRVQSQNRCGRMQFFKYGGQEDQHEAPRKAEHD